MGNKTFRLRAAKAGLAASTAVLFLSPVAEAQVSGATCNIPDGGGTYISAVTVWVDGARTDVRIGERGLTRQIAFSRDDLIDWMRQEFAGGDPDIRVGFNDCSGSQITPLADPPTEGGNPPTPPVLTAGTGTGTEPPAGTAPTTPVVTAGTGTDSPPAGNAAPPTDPTPVTGTTPPATTETPPGPMNPGTGNDTPTGNETPPGPMNPGTGNDTPTGNETPPNSMNPGTGNDITAAIGTDDLISGDNSADYFA